MCLLGRVYWWVSSCAVATKGAGARRWLGGDRLWEGVPLVCRYRCACAGRICSGSVDCLREWHRLSMCRPRTSGIGG